MLKVDVPNGVDGFEIDYEGFIVNFNPSQHIPNYSAWKLQGSKTEGEVKRSNKFRADELVRGCATLADYKKSGWDRGHIAPAADFKWSQTAMDNSHLLTNICPQDKSCNSGIWNRIEILSREWAKRDSVLYIVAGPMPMKNPAHTIGESKVAVPEKFFKVILAPYANPPRAIGFIVDNAPFRGKPYQFEATVDEVERLTGYDFFSALPDDIETKVESESRYSNWMTHK